jgi:hypothetical protein
VKVWMGEDTKQKRDANLAILAFRTVSVRETSSAYLRIFQAPERDAPGLFNVNKLASPSSRVRIDEYDEGGERICVHPI